MICPVCKRDWEDGCEQSVAIKKRGKCIGCIIRAKEHIQMDPYEFPQEDTAKEPTDQGQKGGGK